jgi:cytochrome P450
MQPTASDIRQFDWRNLPDGFHADPFPWYRALRQHDPVHTGPDGGYTLTRYADCAAVYRDPRCSSDKRRMFRPNFGDGPLYDHHTTSLVFNDPPYHTRVRRLLADALRPAAIKAMQRPLESMVQSLLDEAGEKSGDTIDLIEQFASAIPLEVIGNFLTVPRAERGPLRGWSLKILGALEMDISAEQKVAGDQAVEEFCDYLLGLVDRRRKEGQGDATDILSILIRSHDGGELSERELLHNCIFLLNAGHETTTNLIGNGVAELLKHPDQLALLKRSPELIKSAIEEILRYQSPNQLGNRELGEDMEIGGVRLPAGSIITLCIGAANRDPERFSDPERFDIRRQPNPHLAFATGIHSCLGMTLARLEGQVAISGLLNRYPDLQLAGQPMHQARSRFRGYTSLPVRLNRPKMGGSSR